MRNALIVCLVICFTCVQAVGADAPVDLLKFKAGFSRVDLDDGMASLTWSSGPGLLDTIVFSSDDQAPLIGLMMTGNMNVMTPVAKALDPYLAVTVGKRNLSTSAGWTIFFDNPRERPFKRFPGVLKRTKIRVESAGPRTTVIVEGLTAGPFTGDWRLTVFEGSHLIKTEAVLKTEDAAVAYLYDAGLVSKEPIFGQVAWMPPGIGPLPEMIKQPAAMNVQASAIAVRSRVIVGQTGDIGSLAIFPPPHKYLYPLDFAENYGWMWQGVGWPDTPAGSWGVGIRQPPEGDKRWVPWVNAPPGTEQHMPMFLLPGWGKAEEAFAETLRFTRNDRFEPLPGFKTFSSHYHVEHAYDLAAKQKKQGNDRIPIDLVEPGFVKVFKDMGVQIVHLAEFHDGLPGELPPDRLGYLKLLHDECARLSNPDFLLLPGEEPNVHLGGHWISFFPKPVYWTLGRAKGQPFVENPDGSGNVYHVGSADDVLKLMEAEKGLMWTAHARIKGSVGFPDLYRDQPFYQSDRFLGFAWKNMPADYSTGKLGTRVLDLLDDAARWGPPKYAPGEVDIFRLHPGYELYGHMNVNYLKLDAIPKFADGWQGVFDALRGGKFFVTTGEVLIPSFTVGGAESGAETPAGKAVVVKATLKWTMPMAYAELVVGDAQGVTRTRIDLTDTAAFGEKTIETMLDLSGKKWVRLEAWDVATNGAFTQPVWVK